MEPITTPDKSTSPDEWDYWHSLIEEDEAARFQGLQPRTMQKHRYMGTGPRFIRISPTCVRYRRIDLKKWADERLRQSTAEDAA